MGRRSERRLLSAAEIEQQLASLPGWSLRDGRLRRELTFERFEQAWGFMTALAIAAQAMDHHPAFENVYTKVVLELWTHDLGGLSSWDFELACEAQRLLPGAG